MSETFKSAEELKRAFRFEERPEYTDFVPYTKDLGFSVKRIYPPASRYKPPVKKDGTADTVALVGVLYEPTRAAAKRPHLVPLSFRISAYSCYLAKHFDYDFTNEQCPTEESVTRSKQTPRPLDLEDRGSYFFDHDQNRFVDANERHLAGIDIIHNLYETHLATVDKLKGRIFRWRLGAKTRSLKMLEWMEKLFKWLLRIACGRVLEPGDGKRGIFTGYLPEDMKRLKVGSITIFGYGASKNVIVTFCAIVLASFFVFTFLGGARKWLMTVSENSFLALVTSILAIAILDGAAPHMLLWLINRSVRARFWLIFKKVQFK